ncbi:hypothetical protein C8F04DRAFT_1185389 [Mycena alexandri]|uniref:Uncharacterized protein n=1 Tax=Mycena alexandri TaxID=1745969 RepID=A0AAD6WYC1_9AGAR|nr:hypothetical protein C8F04DRAFT_1185389 [Mycena alexandri]
MILPGAGRLGRGRLRVTVPTVQLVFVLFCVLAWLVGRWVTCQAEAATGTCAFITLNTGNNLLWMVLFSVPRAVERLTVSNLGEKTPVGYKRMGSILLDQADALAQVRYRDPGPLHGSIDGGVDSDVRRFTGVSESLFLPPVVYFLSPTVPHPIFSHVVLGYLKGKDSLSVQFIENRVFASGVVYCTTLYGSNGHGNGSPVALLVFGGVTVTMKAVALKKS